MRRRLEFYDNTKTYLAPSYEVFAPDYVASHYAVVNFGKCVVETDKTGVMFYSVTMFETLKDMYDISDSLSDNEALLVIEEIINTPPEQISTSPTAEERIAAALEFQNVLALPVV